jgi:ABC-type dipeptide/oligopeptide/nickel transport system permease component
MLRLALRRLLWTLPALVGISVLTFLFLSFVPEPVDDPAVARVTTRDELSHMRRERFLDLPRFVNTEPRDAKVLTTRAIDMLAQGGADADEARQELARLGGAALPFVLPAFDGLAPGPRARLAIALAPVGQRMGVLSADEAEDPVRAVAFWTRFWIDRGIEFKRASVRSAVRRLVRYGSGSRQKELFELDTFVLDELFEALELPDDAASVDRARRLVDTAAHVTGRDDRIDPADSIATARATVARWRLFWAVYRSDYVQFQGASRFAAMVLETRYGKWVLGAAAQRFGRGADGVLVLDDLRTRAPTTLAILFGGIALAYAIAIPLGALSAARRGSRLDLALGLTVIGLHSLPTAFVAVVLARRADLAAHDLTLPIITVALSLVAAPSRQQRSALATALTQDYVRFAVAKGASRARALLVHALRNALLPVITLAALEAPIALSRVFVVEHVFALHGLGEATIRAVQQKDTPWLLALSLFAAASASVFVIAADVAYAIVDPRLVAGIQRGRG